MAMENLRIIWQIVPPVILFVGIVGNCLTLTTVTNHRCKKSSFTVYLGALAISDMSSLLLMATNDCLFHGFGVDIMMNAVSCKMLAFLNLSIRQLSSFLVGALSVDRMVVIYFQHRVDKVGKPKSALIVTGIAVAGFFILNAHCLHGFKLVTENNLTYCGFVDINYASFFFKCFTWVDATFYFFLPAGVIIMSNIFTTLRVVRVKNGLRDLLHIEALRQKEKQSRQMVVMTITVSMAFIVLTAPFAIFSILRPYVFDNPEAFSGQSYYEILGITITENLGILNWSINFFLYCISGSRFRKELNAAICCWTSASTVAGAKQTSASKPQIGSKLSLESTTQSSYTVSGTLSDNTETSDKTSATFDLQNLTYNTHTQDVYSID